MTVNGPGRPSEPPTDDDWMLGPGAVAWDVMRTPYVWVVGLTGDGLMNTLFPHFATAFLEHDTGLVDPVARIRNTGLWFATAVYGTRGEAERLSRDVRRGHEKVTGREPITGERYEASSVASLALCHVIMWTAMLAAREYALGPLPQAQRDQLLVEGAIVSSLVGLPVDCLPLTTSDAEAFLEERRPQMAVGEHGRYLLKPFDEGRFPQDSFVGGLPAPVRVMLAPFMRAMTDIALATIDPRDVEMMAITRRRELRSPTLVKASAQTAARILEVPPVRDVVEKALHPKIHRLLSRARQLERSLGGREAAKRTFSTPSFASVPVAS